VLVVTSAGAMLVVGIGVVAMACGAASLVVAGVVVTALAVLVVPSAGALLVVCIGVVAMTCGAASLVVVVHCTSVCANHTFQGHWAASGTVGYTIVNCALTSSPVNESQASKRAWPVPSLESSSIFANSTVRKRHLILSTATACAILPASSARRFAWRLL